MSLVWQSQLALPSTLVSHEPATWVIGIPLMSWEGAGVPLTAWDGAGVPLASLDGAGEGCDKELR